VIAGANAMHVHAAERLREYDEHWDNFKETHGKEYESQEHHDERFEIFKENHDFIYDHNERFDNGEHSYALEHNQFSDMTYDEYVAFVRGYSHERKSLRSGDIAHHLKETTDVPESIDWVAEGGVSRVKNQGQCGSCYAFAATGTMEGAVYVATGQLASLSEQHIIDCESMRYGFDDEGCDGGLMDTVFDWVLKNSTGVCAESEYPYEEKNGVRECAHGVEADCTPVATITGYKDVPPQNEQALLAALAQVPVAVAIEASGKGFQFYSKGVFDGECGTELDHGVLAVGYGTDPETGKPFWRIKNSWGDVWGDDGFINIVRGESINSGQGQCGVLIEPSYAIADSRSLLVEEAAIEKESEFSNEKIVVPEGNAGNSGVSDCDGASEDTCKNSFSKLCRWCTSKAVASACYTISEADRLPSAVFSC